VGCECTEAEARGVEARRVTDFERRKAEARGVEARRAREFERRKKDHGVLVKPFITNEMFMEPNYDVVCIYAHF
jgi:hypothetical protein